MAATRENEIGRCRCPVCESTRARLRVTVKQVAYIVCDSCNAQVFARSDRSDELLRKRHIPETEPTPEAPTKSAAPAPRNLTDAAEDQEDVSRSPWGAFPWVK